MSDKSGVLPRQYFRYIPIHLAFVLLMACNSSDREQLPGGQSGSDQPDQADAANRRTAELADLSLSGTARLVPVFSADQLSYRVEVSFQENELRVTPTTYNPNASILVDNMFPLRSGVTSPFIALEVGINSLTVQVTENDGESATYILEITRSAE